MESKKGVVVRIRFLNPVMATNFFCFILSNCHLFPLGCCLRYFCWLSVAIERDCVASIFSIEEDCLAGAILSPNCWIRVINSRIITSLLFLISLKTVRNGLMDREIIILIVSPSRSPNQICRASKVFSHRNFIHTWKKTCGRLQEFWQSA